MHSTNEGLYAGLLETSAPKKRSIAKPLVILGTIAIIGCIAVLYSGSSHDS